MERLNPRIQLIWGAVALLTAAVLGGVTAGVAFFLDRAPLTIGAGAFVLVAILGVVHAVARFRIWRFEVQEDALFLERGVLTRVNTVVPFVRIQHIDTQRNPFERLIGLSSVVVYTAGSRGADVTIPGLLPSRATSLQERLRTLVGEREADDAV